MFVIGISQWSSLVVSLGPVPIVPSLIRLVPGPQALVEEDARGVVTSLPIDTTVVPIHRLDTILIIGEDTIHLLNIEEEEV